MPVDTIEQQGSVVAPKIEGRETNPSDEVLELITQNPEDAIVSGAPVAESAGLWNKPEVPSEPIAAPVEQPIAPITETEAPRAEAPISMDSSFSGVPAQTRVETVQAQDELSKYADGELRAVGEVAADDPFDVKIEMPKAEAMIEETEKNPGRGIHHQMEPAAKAELTADIEKGIEKADEKLEDLLARLKQERDGLRERATREKEEKANKLSELIEEKKVAEQELLDRHATEKKEFDERYDQEIEGLTQDLTSIEQVLSEI